MTGGQTATMRAAETSNFGIVSGVKPAARDGHSADISDEGLMFIFGGDRHHMPFNDLYLMRLWTIIRFNIFIVKYKYQPVFFIKKS